jgi:glycerophosphoryl diester phosphodiesterase
MDLRFTAGSVPVLLHDTTVDRTTDGTGAVAAMSLAELRSLDAGSWFAARYAGVKVPTLYQVLRYGRTRGATFLVELKTRPTTLQMRAFLARLRWLDVMHRVRVTSFDEQTILDVRAAQPGLRTGISDYPNDRAPDSALMFGRRYLSHHAAVTAERVASMRAQGVTIHPWPADSRRTWARLARHGTGPVITNRPSAYLVWARGYCS